jgi:hypothetical protein
MDRPKIHNLHEPAPPVSAVLRLAGFRPFEVIRGNAGFSAIFKSTVI